MFFLLRTAFWLTIALALLPTGQPERTAQAPDVNPVDALIAAGSAVSDMSGFCQRQVQACEVGSQTVGVIGQRAMAGGKMVYEFINGQIAGGQPGETAAAHPVAQHPVAQHPVAQVQTGSLPRPRPLPEGAPRIAAPQTTPTDAAPQRLLQPMPKAAPRRGQAERIKVVLPVPVARSRHAAGHATGPTTDRTTLTPRDLEPQWRNPNAREARPQRSSQRPA